MARAPPVNLFRPPDRSHLRRSEETNKAHQESSPNSSYNSTKSRNTEAMNIAISEKELDGIQKFISPDRDMVIHRKLFSGEDSPNQGLQHTQKSHDSITPFGRSDEAILEKIGANPPETRLQIRPTSPQFRGDLTTGDCSLGEEVHLTAISSKIAGQISGDMNSGEQIVEGDAGATEDKFSPDEEFQPTNISIKLTQEHNHTNIQTRITKYATNPQIELEDHSCRIEDEQQTFSQDQVGPNGQKQEHNAIGKQHIDMEVTQVTSGNHQGQKDQLDTTSSTNLEIIDVENSSHFSFGVKPMDTIPRNGAQQNPGMILKYNNAPSHVSMQEQQQTNISSMSKKPNIESNQAGKFSHSNSSKNDVNLSSSDIYVNDSVPGQKNVLREEQKMSRGDTEPQQHVNRIQSIGRDKNVTQPADQGGNTQPNNYHRDFPKLSSNFDRHTNSNQQNHQTHQANQSKEPSNPNANQNTKQNQSVEPAPYTVVQTLAARLRQIHATQTTTIELVPPKHTTKQGQPAVIFAMDDFMNKLAVDCKYTLIGKFSSTMPKIELIRKSFIQQTQLNGGVNIAHYNARHVFIDLENELDYNTVWTQQRMTIEGKLMRIQAWSPNFRPEEETPIVPIWVLLPGLPWHCFKKEFITPLLESVGKVLYLDTASIKRTRASMAKVKVQVDLTKARPRHVWIGLDEEDLTIGRWQPIEYENIPPYCAYCKHQGHMIGDCNFKIRDEDLQRRKELGAEMKTISNSEQGQQGKEHRQVRPREQEEQQNQNTNEGQNQLTPEQQKDEEWHVSRRRNNKSQEEKTQKAVWRPTSPKNKVSRDQPQPMTQQKGINNISDHNFFSNLSMQEKQSPDIQRHNNKEGKATHDSQRMSKTNHNRKEQIMQSGIQANNKSTGIDSMLPIPTNPNILIPNVTAEVEGGMDGGCQESHNNLQEKGSKGRNLPHVMHEGTHLDHNPDLRAPATTTVQLHQQVQQQVLSGPEKRISTENTKEKQQVRAGPADKQNKGAMAKDMGAKASTSNQGNTPKSKNKPSKKKREAAKKRQSIQQNNVQQGAQQKEGKVCKRFIMVDDQLGMDITPLQTQYMNPPISVPPDDTSVKCQLNTGPIIDEYAVDNSEDEPDLDNQSLKDPDDDDETSEFLIRAFSPHPDKDFAEEIQQVANSQGLSPRGIHHERFKFQVQDINIVTAGRPNTRLFTSPSSQ